MCVCVRCVGETTAKTLRTATAADEACGPPDSHSDHSSESLSQEGNKTQTLQPEHALDRIIQEKDMWNYLTARFLGSDNAL